MVNTEFLKETSSNIFWKNESLMPVAIMMAESAKEIEELRKDLDAAKIKIYELQDFCIWLTGCGYDFCQHDYYLKKREELIT